MNLFLVAAAIATAQPAPAMSFDRMIELQSKFPEVCDVATRMKPVGGNYADTLLMYADPRNDTEKLFAMVVCKNYLMGKISQ